MRGGCILVLSLHALADVVVIAGAAWWARKTVARLEGQHQAINKTQAIPTRDAVLMARMDMLMGDVVRELREISTTLQAILRRDALTAGHAEEAETDR